MSKISSKKEDEKDINEGLTYEYLSIPQGYTTSITTGVGKLGHGKKPIVTVHSDNDNSRRISKLEREISLLRKSLLLLNREDNRPIRIKRTDSRIKYRLQSPFSSNKFDVIFEKNNYIESEEGLWKLIYIIDNESFFKSTLEKFNFLISKNFIEFLFQNSNQNFYIDHFSHKISTNKIYNSYYKTISLFELLQFLNIDKIENLIEKGSVFYE